jgi:hypothetical protein
MFTKHKEFDYSISKLTNLEIDYNAEGNNSEENKLNELFNALSCYTYSVRFVKIKITSHNDISFTTRIIKNIVNFIAHQFNLEALSLNESLISENLSELEEIINSQSTNLKYLKIGGKLKSIARKLKVLRNCVNLKWLEFGEEKEVIIGDYMQDVKVCDYYNYYLEEDSCGEVGEVEEFEFNQLKIESIYCIEDCVSTDYRHLYDEREVVEIMNGNVINKDIVTLSLERTLIMTNINLRTLNLGKINSVIITTLGKYCYKLTHLSCELSFNDFLLFIKLLEVLRGLEHLKLKLKLSSIINDNCIVAFANSLSNSLQKLGLNIYIDEEGNNEFITYFLAILLKNLYCNNLFELDFYNDQMIKNNNLQLILQFAFNRIGFGSYGGSRKFKLFKYVRKNFNVDFDHVLLQNGREIIQIECEETSDFHGPFFEPFCYEKD